MFDMLDFLDLVESMLYLLLPDFLIDYCDFPFLLVASLILWIISKILYKKWKMVWKQKLIDICEEKKVGFVTDLDRIISIVYYYIYTVFVLFLIAFAILFLGLFM